jgi:aldose 1-epimerase
VEAAVANPGDNRLPFGIGYHPYFRPPGLGEAAIDAAVLQVESSCVWEARDNLPTGRVVSAPGGLNFRTERPIGPTEFDHVFTELPGGTEMRTVATLAAPGSPRQLAIRADAAFRELVLFTPVHRGAIAIEPYTCSTDAANLGPRGIPAGWRDVPPGGRFEAAVEYRLGVKS